MRLTSLTVMAKSRMKKEKKKVLLFSKTPRFFRGFIEDKILFYIQGLCFQGLFAIHANISIYYL